MDRRLVGGHQLKFLRLGVALVQAVDVGGVNYGPSWRMTRAADRSVMPPSHDTFRTQVLDVGDVPGQLGENGAMGVEAVT